MGTPLYKQVYNDIKKGIMEGFYKTEERLPSDKELMEKYGVSSITIKNALEILKKEGYISRKPHEGTIVMAPKSQPTYPNVKFPLIGFILTNYDNAFGSEILSSVIHHCDGRAYPIIKLSDGNPAREEQMIRELIELGIDGIILLPCSSKTVSTILLDLVSRNFPLVVIDRTLEALPVCSVNTNNEEAGKAAADYLFECGHKSLGIITSYGDITTTKERIDGFILAHASHNLALNHSLIYSEVRSVVPDCSTDVSEDIDGIMNFLIQHPELEGLIATEYNIALLIQQAVAKLNKKIPDDISVICFDHTDNYFMPEAFRFTHIRQNQKQIGASSVEMVLEKIKNPSYSDKLIIDFTLVPGDSIRKN